MMLCHAWGMKVTASVVSTWSNRVKSMSLWLWIMFDIEITDVRHVPFFPWFSELYVKCEPVISTLTHMSSDFTCFSLVCHQMLSGNEKKSAHRAAPVRQVFTGSTWRQPFPAKSRAFQIELAYHMVIIIICLSYYGYHKMSKYVGCPTPRGTHGDPWGPHSSHPRPWSF